MKNAMSDKLLCTIFRCGREAEMYLYVKREELLTKVPPELQGKLGKLTEVMTLALTAERKLARVKTSDVLAALNDRGYYLQLPPDFNPARFTLGG